MSKDVEVKAGNEVGRRRQKVREQRGDERDENTLGGRRESREHREREEEEEGAK